MCTHLDLYTATCHNAAGRELISALLVAGKGIISCGKLGSFGRKRSSGLYTLGGGQQLTSKYPPPQLPI
jgi:hypothetical protein